MKKHKRIWMAGVAVLLTVSILTVNLVFNTTQVSAAKPTFIGISEIIQENSEENTFHIVELVPDDNMGSIGYYIGGEEPMHDALARLQSGKDRFRYVENLQALLTEKGVMGDAESTTTPLARADYEELYQGQVPDAQLQQLVTEGNYREFVRDASISGNFVSANKIAGCTISTNSLLVNSIYNYRMAVSANEAGQVSGNFIPLYQPNTVDVSGNTISENDAYRFFKGENTSFTVSEDQVGMFDPNFVAEGEGIHFEAIFEATTGKAGYLPREERTEIEVGADWTENFVEGTPVYKVVDGVYVCVGTMQKSSNKIALKTLDGSAPHIVTSLDGQTGEGVEAPTGAQSDEDAPVVEVSENEISGKAGNKVTSEVSGNESDAEVEAVVEEVAEEKVEEETTKKSAKVRVVSALEGEMQTGEAVGEGLYILSFVYDTGSEDTHYQVSHMEQKAEGTYILNKEQPLVANWTGTGLVNPNFESLDLMEIVYSYVESDGIYHMESEADSEVAVTNCKIYYRGGLTNNEWFKQYVFDREYVEGVLEPVYLEVSTITASEFMSYDLSQADMLYVTNEKGTFIPATEGVTYEFDSYGGENDITRRRIIDVIASVVDQKFPVMADRSLLTDTDANGTVMQEFVQVLDLPSMSVFYEEFGSLSDEQLAAKDIPTTHFDDDDGHHVNESIYMFSTNTYTGELSLNTGFFSVFTEEYIKDGFEEIKDEIEVENNFIKEENKGGLDKELLSEDISEAVAIKYILSMISKRGIMVKDDLTILELEPLNYQSSDLEVEETTIHDDKNNIDVIAYNLKINGKKVIEESTKKINVVTMSTSEYIGKIEDINSKYDMIYIGLNTGTGRVRMKTFATNHSIRSNRGRTSYVDTTMNGLVYTNVGDITTSVAAIDGHTFFIGDMGNTYRFSGNDLTKQKVEELQEYVSAGYPVIMAENFFTYRNDVLQVYDKQNNDEICSGYIDNSSYMYEFADWALTYVRSDRNVMRFRQANTNGVDTDLLQHYIELAKPSLDYDSTASGVTTHADGNRYMDFYFKIYNKGNVAQSPRFGCNLYLDTNADGKFSKTKERVQNGVITDTAGNVVEATSLRPGVSYRMSLLMSDMYTGIVTWKLEATQTGSEKRLDSETGYYLVPGTEKIKINALQIMSNGDAVDNWDMETALNTPGSLFRQYAITDPGISNYDISVTSVEAADFVKNYKEINLDSYNMLIMGFADCYVISQDDKDADAMDAIVDYIKSGKSVLFTHDTTSFHGGWGRLFNQKIRELVGLDRYGVTGDTTKCKEIMYEPNSKRTKKLTLTQGYSNQALGRAKVGSKWDTFLQFNINGQPNYADSTGAGNNLPTLRSEVEQVNTGQITDYPYQITTDESPKISIAKTHSQYYQLDLAGDFDKDDEEDIVVWYSISGSDEANTVYQYTPRDVRNNYYIFSRGNVTYSGAGHSNMEKTNNVKEVQLFVNTLVASYNTGVKAPVVSIIEDETDATTMIDNLYAPFDYNYNLETATGTTSGNYIDTTETVCFYVADTNLIKHSAELSAKIYYEDSASEKTIDVGGETIHVSELDLNAYPIVDPETDLPVTAAGMPAGVEDANSRALTDRKVYRMQIPVSILGTSNSKQIYVVATDNIKLTESAEVKTLTSNDSISYTKVQLFNLD